MIAHVRPSSELRNHYNEIARTVKEMKEPIVITVNGREDTAILGVQELRQMQSELHLLRELAWAEADVREGRVAPVQDTFDEIRAQLQTRKHAYV